MLGDKKESMKRRVELIMNRNKKASKIGTVAAVLASVILSGTTVFAYTPMQTIENQDSSDTLSGSLDFNITSSESIFSQYDFYFESDTHEILPIDESDLESRAILCSHNFEYGYANNHIPQSNGGCIIKTYEAKHCTKCNHYVLIKLITTATYTKCIHK